MGTLMGAKVLYIMYDGLTDPLGQSQVLPYLTQLAQLGYQITIISCEKKNKFQKRRNIIQEILDTFSIQWQYCFFENKYPILSPLKNLQKLWALASEAGEKNYAIIHCRSQLAAEIGLKFRNKYGGKLLFDMRGFWADEKYERKSNYHLNPIYKALKYREKKLLLNSDAIITLTHTAKEYIEKKYFSTLNTNLAPINVIPCCADFVHFSKQNIKHQIAEDYRQKLGLNDRFTIIYLGSLGTFYKLDSMLKWHQYACEKYGLINFLILTQDNWEHHLKIAEKLNNTSYSDSPLKDCYFVKEAERSEIPYYLSLAHLAIYFIEPTFAKIGSSPTKLAELLAMELPIITNSDIGDINEQMKKYNFGRVISDFTQKSLLESTQIISDIDYYQSKNLRAIGNQLFSLELGVEELKKIYSNMIDKD